MKFWKPFASLMIAGTMLLSSAAVAVSAAEPSVGENAITTSEAGDPRAAGRPSGLTRDEITALIPDITPSGQNILVSGTRVTANIFGGWDNPTSNSMIRDLIYGNLSTLSGNMGREFFPNPMVTREFEVTDNADGSRTYTFTIYTDNQFSDGTYINASHYAGGIALLSHNVWRDIADTATTGHQFVGRNEWINGEADTHAGVRLYSDEKFSVTIRADELPEINELPMFAWWGPSALHEMIPGTEVKDDGDGVYFDPPITFEYLNPLVNGSGNNPGWRYHPTVSNGPYMFESFDPATSTAILRANPYFPGTWDGFKPRIETLIFTYRDQAIMIDSMALGEVDMMVSTGSGAILINPGLDRLVYTNNPTHDYISYERHGYGFIRFHVDHGPTQFPEVRQAIKWLIDRDEFAFLFTAGHGAVIQGPYSLSQWFYHEGVARGLYDRLINYTYNPTEAIRVLEEGGWVLNSRGEPFVLGVDDVRYKDISALRDAGLLQNDNRTQYANEADRPADPTIEGDLMRLQVDWLTWFTDANAITAIIDIMIPQELIAVGFDFQDHRVQDALVYVQRMAGRPAQYHMFNQGVNFNASVYSPWNSLRPDPDFMGGGFNSNFVADQELFELAQRMQFGELLTEEGRDNFVEQWMDFIEMMNYLVLDIPLYADIFYDFIPLNIRNWHNNSIWGYADAITRAYIEN